jgi:hypothetical protein
VRFAPRDFLQGRSRHQISKAQSDGIDGELLTSLSAHCSGSSVATLVATDLTLRRNCFDSAMLYQQSVPIPSVVSGFLAAKDSPVAP